MHPDAIIAGLRRELERLDKSAEDYADRKKAIEDEIARVDDEPRPEVAPEAPETVVDHNVSYLAGLRRELERVADEAKAEVRKEIKRVEALMHHGDEKPAPELAPEPVKPDDEKSDAKPAA